MGATRQVFAVWYCFLTPAVNISCHMYICSHGAVRVQVKAVMPFLAQSLSQLSQRRPGTVGPLLSGQGAAASAPLEQLRNYLTSTGAPIS